ncbi:uncharacterized protein LOC127796770 [Diospyros lotus]|uniref:uncharacterized protein LOC127796770 n=1 Tax=Diospyros lotus TaxID=55363 RepID=UPI0022534D9E|nr:uncharacterized protein LOC127796770 [Diospyros lotus]
MPPEPLPWDRKERKHERSSEPLGPVSRWRDSPHHHGSSFSSRDFARSRPPGHSRQAGWHLYSEESGHGLTPFRFNEKILDDENCRPSGTRADGKHSRNSRDNRGSSSQKDWKGHSWENGASPHGPGRPVDVSDQKSVDNMLTCKSYPPDFKNTWDPIHFKDQHDKTCSVNGLTTGQRFERENSLGPIDWKPLKWTRSGSLSSRGSGFSHSSSSKSMGVDSAETKSEVQPRNASPAQSPSADALVCTTSAAPSEETNSRKKPRLNWGEGLAKYEKKKVEGPDDGATNKQGIVACASLEHLPSPASNLADKSPRIAGFSDCASPATPSSVACSSSPGLEEKPFVKTANIDNDAGNLSGSPRVLSQDHLEGREFNLNNLEITPIANLISSVSELLQSDNPVLVDSSFVRSTAINKLLSWKGSILKALETTELEIDSLENELKLLISDSGNSPCPAASSSLQDKCEEKSREVVTSNLIGRPATLQLPSSEDMIAEKVVSGLVEEHAQSRDEYVDSPGTVTSKFVEPFSSVKDSTLSDPIKHGESPVDLDSSKCRNLEVECAVYPSNKEKTGLSVSDGDGQLIASKSYPASPDRNDISCDLILSSNKDSANQASEVFNKVLPSENCHIDTFSTNNGPIDPLVKEKFAMRKHFLTFKERVIAVKFRAFQQLWKEDMRLLSIRKNRTKSHRRLELSSRITHGNYQKHRSSVRSRFSAPALNQSLVPNTVILNSMSKLLSDSSFKLYRNSLKMPALILDKEKTNSMFISSNSLVQDPFAAEKERAMINPWTTEEKQIFMDNLATFGKDFGKIASFLDHKTTADCIEFYYKNHKSDSFVKIKKKPQFANNYLVTSGKRWNPEINAASLDMLGAASAIASNADGMENQRKCTARFLLRAPSDHNIPQGDVDFKEAGSPHSFCNERETEAADVLAGICGSLSSEAMSSCITSSFDLGESYPDWKCQWLCSSIRRPLTPDVTQNVDDETCSDESCGEMDYTDWKDEEKSIFIQAVSSYGTDFAMISRCVRTKSKDQCKVFFSKARKCLGLDNICPRPDDGAPIRDDANGGGTDNEDACVVEACLVVCSEKSGSKMDEDMLLSDFNLKHCESDPMVTMSLQTDLSIEDNNGAGKIDCKGHERQLVPMPTHNLQAEGKLEIDISGESKMENGVDSTPLMVQPQKDAHLIPADIEAEVDEAAGEGNSMAEPMAVEELNDQQCLPVSGAGDELTGVASDSTVLLKSEQEGLMVSENNLNVKQDENGVANTGDLNCLNKDMHSNANASDLAANTNAPMDFNICPKQEHGHKIILDLNPPHKPHAISVEQDVLLVNAKCMNEDSSASQYKQTIRQDPPLVLDFRNISEWQLKKSTSLDNDSLLQPGSVLGHVESHQVLSGYPVPVMAKKEMNGDIGSLKLASSQSLSKVKGDFDGGIYLSQECFLQKCNSPKAQTSVVELPFLSHEQKNTHSRHHSWSSSDSEKPFRNGDVKLFGKILTHQSSQQKQNTSCIHENEDNGVEHSKCLKYNGTNSVDTNSVPAKFDSNNYLGLEKVPVRSYGYWDGNRIQTGFSTLPDSAILLAKYPAAFGNYSTSSNMEQQQQQPLHSVGKSNERNLNGLSVFPSRDMTNSNGVVDYHLYRNREGIRVQPFTVDIKQQQQQRQDVLFCDAQNRNGFESIPSIQQQARGVVGINVVGRGGIIGGACTTGVSDPVAALKMHYAKTEQYGGGGGSISREEESWRGGEGGDVGR